VAEDTLDVQYVTIHGHKRAYVKAGSGPVLLLLHGLACDHTTWDPVIGELAKRYTVVAPDLLGHGLSDKPRADYSLGGYANGMRDLLTVLDIDKVTVVGHSFGGGVAMQFAYQFPERTERMVLIAAGGLGPEVTALIRLIQTPGWEPFMRVQTQPVLRHVTTAAMRALSRTGHKFTRDLGEAANIVDSWADPRTRFAIRHLVRGVIDWKGQIVTMTDRAYLTETMPMVVIWGRDDQVLPVQHINTAAMLASQAQTTVFPNSGHFPHKDHPDRFVKVITDFMRTTQPSTYSRARVRSLLRRGSLITVQSAEGGQPPVKPVKAFA
jgi:pimeloyl-ACP methyl ester carboxylesterase